MTDIFRSEILAVVMQQILDEPVLPTLFMRTVSSRHFHARKAFILTRVQGDPSRQDVQVAQWFRLDDITLPTDHQKDLDDASALGGLYSLCGYCRAPELSGATTTPKGATARTGGQTAAPAGSTARICPEKRRQSCTRRYVLGDHWRG